MREADHWHDDETDRHMFAAQPDKRGYRWHLWLFQSAEVAYFQHDPTRSAAVPMNGLGTAVEGVLSVDRYGAYQTYARLNDKVLRALCWAHQRRDILHWPSSSRSLAVADRIGRLYHLHAERRGASRTRHTSGTAIRECVDTSNGCDNGLKLNATTAQKTPPLEGYAG